MAIAPTGSPLTLQRETLQKLTPTAAPAKDTSIKPEAATPPVVIISQVGCVLDKKA